MSNDITGLPYLYWLIQEKVTVQFSLLQSFSKFLSIFSCFFFPFSHIFQIEYVVDGSMPSDLSEVLVLDKKELDRLHERIQQLQAEKLSQKYLHHEARLQHSKLIHDRRDMAAEIQSKAGRAEARRRILH